jgi:apolipoprotein N-acyltransferase
MSHPMTNLGVPSVTSASAPAARPFELGLRVLIAGTSAALLSLLAPPANVHWLHWVAYVPFLWVLRAETPRSNRWMAWLYGTIAVAVLFRWIVDTIVLFSNISMLPAVGVLLLFSGVFGAPYVPLWAAVHPLRRALGSGWILALPALQVVLEWLSMHVLLFPYNHGVSQYRFPFTWQLASVTGIWGLSYLVFFVNCVLGEAIYRAREGRAFPVRWASAAVSTVSLVILFGGWRFHHVEEILREAPVLRVAQLQSDKTMTERLSRPARESFADWVGKTSRIPPGTADLVVWPEGACPYTLQTDRYQRVFAQLATHGGYEMIVGGGARTQADGESVAFNSTYRVDPTGEVTGRYDKMVPLPFGEYMPFSKQLPWLADLVEGIGDFRAGTEPTILEGRWRYATPICYEAILSGVCQTFREPDLFVNVTNDAWFGDTAAPHQHAMLAAVRSIELGVPTFRSAYTGASMVIEPHGVIHSETVPFSEVDRIAAVRMATFPTLYSRMGDWFVVLCAVGLAAALGAAPWLRRRRTRPPAP